MRCARCEQLYDDDSYWARRNHTPPPARPPRLAVAMRCSCGETLCAQHWHDHTTFRGHNTEPLEPKPTMQLKGELSKSTLWRKRRR